MRVLIVDDDLGTRLTVAAAVRFLGHDLELADSGEEAWTLCKEIRFDAIVCDRSMPGMGGDAFCRMVRADPALADSYFIFLTASSDRESVTQGMDAGCDDYLVKPLNRDELAARLVVAGKLRGLHDMLADRQREIERLNVALREQAAKLKARFKGADAPAGEDPGRSFQRNLSDADSVAHVGHLQNVEGARLIHRARLQGNKIFNAKIMSDPKFEMLLELYVANFDQRRLSLGDLCAATTVPLSTALRHVETLEAQGFLTRAPDPFDARRWLVAPTEKTLYDMEALMSLFLGRY